jgi:negative regulator of flagellin synthesis FlgM
MYNQIGDATPESAVETDNHLQTRHQEINHLIDGMTHVNISSTTKQLEAIKNSLREISEINEARVLFFKSEIALGNYQINDDNIAKRMFNVEPA